MDLSWVNGLVCELRGDFERVSDASDSLDHTFVCPLRRRHLPNDWNSQLDLSGHDIASAVW